MLYVNYSDIHYSVTVVCVVIYRNNQRELCFLFGGNQVTWCAAQLHTLLMHMPAVGHNLCLPVDILAAILVQ